MQRFASCNIYYLKTYASTECLKQTSTLQTFACIMNWMEYHVVSSFVTYGSFFVSARDIKKYNSPKLFFCCSIYSLQHYAHHRKTHCCAFCQLRKLFSVAFTRKSTTDCVLLRLYPLLPKTALPTTQSSFTKSNDSTVTAHYVPFAREKSLTSLTPV